MSMAGVSGAVALLPFQMSVLGYASPGVSATNLIYNLVAVPGGAYSYVREGRMLWPIAVVVAAGTMPGVILGGWIRTHHLAEQSAFKTFAACLLILIGLGLLRGAVLTPKDLIHEGDWKIRILEFSRRYVRFRFLSGSYRCGTIGLVLLAFLTGALGGIYGIGGGAIMAPLLVIVWRLPVHAFAGATLAGTFATSLAGVAYYQWLSPRSAEASPDWILGLLFGAGGLAGMYTGARMQRRVPVRWLKALLGVVLLAVASLYLSAGIARGASGELELHGVVEPAMRGAIVTLHGSDFPFAAETTTDARGASVSENWLPALTRWASSCQAWEKHAGQLP